MTSEKISSQALLASIPLLPVSAEQAQGPDF